MHNANSRLDFVHVLSAFAAGTVSIDLKIDRIDLNRRGVGDFRNNIDTGEGSMASLVRIEGRNAHQAMHAAFRIQISVGVISPNE